jgi:cytochrome P450
LDQTGFRPPIPAPRKAPLNLLSLLGVLLDNPLEAWTEAHFEQTVVRDRLFFMPAVVVSEPDAIQHVLLDNAANYRKDDLLLRILSSGLKDGLLTVEGERWRRQRRAVAPMFARKTIYDFAPAVKAAIDELVARWREVSEGGVIDVAEDITRLTLDVLQRTIFSNGLERGTDEFRESMRTYFDSIGRIDPFDVLGLPDVLPRPTRRSERSAVQFFNSAVDSIIEERRRVAAEGRPSFQHDLLTLLLEAASAHAEHPLSEAELRANVITFIAAGHETTANALIWSLLLLSKSEEWAARVAAEAKLGTGKTGDDPCGNLVITRAVIEEALRLYPPIAAISRVAIGPDEIAGESIRAGTMVIVAPYVVHRHRRLWDRPDVFDPGRFLGAAREHIHRYAYLPFGAGPRICIGQAFALQEASLALAAIAGNFRLSLAPGFEVEPLLRITLRPRDGMRMVVHHRTAKSASAKGRPN